MVFYNYLHNIVAGSQPQPIPAGIQIAIAVQIPTQNRFQQKGKIFIKQCIES